MKRSNKKKFNSDYSLKYIAEGVDLLASHILRVDVKLTDLEGNIGKINEKLVVQDYRMGKMETQMNKLEDKVDDVNDNLKGFAKEYNVRVSALEKKSH